MVCSSRTSSWYRLAAAAASPSRVSSCSTAKRACCLQGMTAATHRVDSAYTLALMYAFGLYRASRKLVQGGQQAAAFTEQAASLPC